MNPLYAGSRRLSRGGVGGLRISAALGVSLLLHLAVFASFVGFSRHSPTPRPPEVTVDLAMLAPSEAVVESGLEALELATADLIEAVEEPVTIAPATPIELREAQALDVREAAPEVQSEVAQTSGVPATEVAEAAVTVAEQAEPRVIGAIAAEPAARPTIAAVEPAPGESLPADEPSAEVQPLAAIEAESVEEPQLAEPTTPRESLVVMEEPGPAVDVPPPAKPLDLPRGIRPGPATLPAAEVAAVPGAAEAEEPSRPPAAKAEPRDGPAAKSAASLLARLEELKDESLQAEEDPKLWAVIRAVRHQIARCWTASDRDRFRVDIDVAFDRDGRLKKALIKQPGRMVADPAYRDFAIGARRALSDCSPFELPGESYDVWQQFTMRFVPSGRSS